MGVRQGSRWLAVVLSAAGLVLVAGCAGSAAKSPTVASVPFDPTAELHIGDTGQLTFMLHEVSSGAAAVPAGSVLLVVNDGQVDHRIRAGSTFDTGTLQPGNETTIVLSDEGELTLVDTTTGREAQLTVTPRA